MKKSFIWLLVLIGSFFASNSAQDRWITVFLHGGGAHPLYLNMSDTLKILNDNIDDSVYTKTTQLLRDDPYFFKVQPQQGEGLRKAFPITPFDPHNGAQLFSLMFDLVSQLVHFPSNEFYSFGWSGFLSIKARRLAAEKLYDSLAALYARMLAEGDIPHLRVVAYSHGGNVALHVGEIAKQRGTHRFTVDELILVATPIQANSQNYLGNAIFKNIFLFYSIGDQIQNSDFLSSPTHSFAQRSFKEQPNFKIPKNVTQVQVRIVRKHIFVRQKDGSRRMVKQYTMIHPNHTEMFFFGWAPEWYRLHFPLKPMSVGMFVPLFVQTVYNHHLAGNNLRFTLSPDDETMTIDIKGTSTTTTYPFMNHATFTELRNRMWHYKPADIAQYQDRMHKHWDTAKKQVRQERRARLQAAQRGPVTGKCNKSGARGCPIA